VLPDSFIEELRYRSDIESVVGGYVRLKRRGKNLLGLCPFHNEKTPSFTVYPENQSFYCFGCGTGGDVITFVRKAENLDYIEAIKLLADRAGMKMPEDGVDDHTARLKTRILELNRESARFFHQQFSTPAGRRGLDYLRARGLSDNTIRRFGLGYAPEGWDNLRNFLSAKGYTKEEMLAAAVVAQGRNNSTYDLFRGRVMFPIIDLRGAVIGFGGRAMDEKGPKYLNSPDTPVFKKSRNLFALNVAKATKRSQLILCEGYMDVIAVHQGGFDNAVATLGTSLTSEQARIISQYTNEVVVAYDSDGAGQAAAKRAINIFDSTGVAVKVLSITGAKDPDEFLKKYGPERFEILLSGSAGATDYNIARIKQKFDMDTADGRVAFLKEFTTLLAEIRNPIEREVYAAREAEASGINKQAILAEVESKIKRRQKAKEKKEDRDLRPYTPGPPGAVRQDPDRLKYPKYAIAEEKLLGLLFKHPDCYAKTAEKLPPERFVTAFNRQLYQAVCGKLAQHGQVNLSMFVQELNDEEMNRLSWITSPQQIETITRDGWQDYVDTILGFAQQPSSEEIRSMSNDEWAKIFQNK